MRPQSNLAMRVLPVLDSATVAFAVAWVWPAAFARPFPDFFLVLLIVPLFEYLYRFFRLYDSHRIEGLWTVTRRIFSAQLVGSLAVGAGLVLAAKFDKLSAFGLFLLLSTGVLVLERQLIYGLLQLLRSRGVDKRQVCVIGSWETAERMASQFAENPQWGLHVTLVGRDHQDRREYFSYPSRKAVEGELDSVLTTQVVDEVLIAVRTEQFPQEIITLRTCEQHGVLCRVLLQPLQAHADRGRVEAFGDDLCVAYGNSNRHGIGSAQKRIFDVVATVLFGIAVSPILLLIALLVKLSSSGTVLFKQTRVGLNGRHFTMYKFRTMLAGAEALVRPANQSIARGPIFKDPSDYRVTDIGRLLRRFSVDELPQLFNVVKGDMSLVGPRPLPVAEAQAILGPYRRRFSVLPGLTCVWQVSGRSDVSYEKWMQYDLEYVDSWSLWLDAKLLLLTIPAVFYGRGAY